MEFTVVVDILWMTDMLALSPKAGDMKELLPVLKSVKGSGLKLTLHVAEVWPIHNCTCA